MLKFVLQNIVHTDIESAYDMLCNPEMYQSVIPNHYPSVRVLSVRGNTMIAEEHLFIGRRELIIMAKHVFTPPHRLETFVIGGDAKRSHITHDLVENKKTPDEINLNNEIDHNIPYTTITTSVEFNMGRFAFFSRHYTSKSVKDSFKSMMHDLVNTAESK